VVCRSDARVRAANGKGIKRYEEDSKPRMILLAFFAASDLYWSSCLGGAISAIKAENTHSASYSPARRQLANLHPTFNTEVL
jgi:hypothetical protein